MDRAESVIAIPQRFVPGSIPRILDIPDLQCRSGAQDFVDAGGVTSARECQSRRSPTTTTNERRKFLHRRRSIERPVRRDRNGDFFLVGTNEHHRTTPALLEILRQRTKLLTRVPFDARNKDVAAASLVKFLRER
jgi:hypothetical protein